MSGCGLVVSVICFSGEKPKVTFSHNFSRELVRNFDEESPESERNLSWKVNILGRRKANIFQVLACTRTPTAATYGRKQERLDNTQDVEHTKELVKQPTDRTHRSAARILTV